MEISEKYLRKYTDDYALFAYREWDKHPTTGEQLTGTYSEAGIEVEQAEKFAEITRMELAKRLWMRVLIMLDKKDYANLEKEANLSVDVINEQFSELEKELGT